MVIVSERVTVAQLGETGARLSAISAEIRSLQRQVLQGTDGRQQALASCYARRRERDVRRESLNWVLC